MGKRQAIKEKRKRDNLIKQVVTIFLIVVVAVFIVGVMIYPTIKKATGTGDFIIPEAVGKHSSTDMTMGDPNAPVTVEVYSDYQCSHCGIYASTVEPDFIKDYVDTGKVYYIFRPFNFLGEGSIYAAEAAYCAMDQGDFWSFHDVLYANMFGETTGLTSMEQLTNYAVAAGLNGEAFDDCLASDKYATQYEIDNEYARSQGIEATPSFKIGDAIVGYGDLIATVDEALANQ
jgi:protein-disulfide isomerase